MGAKIVVVGLIVFLVLLYCWSRNKTSEDFRRSPRTVPAILPEWTESDYENAYQNLQAQLAKAFKVKCGDKVYIPFYSFHLKRMVFPVAATLELVNNWIAFILTIVLLGADSLAVAILSFISLLVGQLIVHFTYGYNRYANPGSNFISSVESRLKDELSASEANFERTCEMFDYLYHGKLTPSSKDTCTMGTASVFFRLLNDVAVICVCVAVLVAIIVSYCGGTLLAANEAASNPYAENRNFAFIILILLILLASTILELAFVASGTMGSIVGATIWASLSIAGEASDVLPLVIVANVMLYLVEEYYTALLFNKSPAEFGNSMLYNIFYDVISETEVIGSNLPENAKTFFDVETQENDKDKTKPSEKSSEHNTENTTSTADDDDNTDTAPTDAEAKDDSK
jgi:hypothetical protein